MNVREYDPGQHRYIRVRPTPAPGVRNSVRHQYYEVLRKAKLYLRIQPDFDPHLDQGDEVDDGDVRRPFCCLFRNVWLGLKTDGKNHFRQDMLRYWTQADEQPVPRLALDYGCHLIGGYEQPTRSFTFNIECVELALRDGQLGNLIAHELGHAWHDTRPDSNIRMCGPTSGGSEQEADDIATQWGYDMESLQNWRDEKKEQIAIFTGQKARPIPDFDPSTFESML
jgi:hypothetical protein